MTDLLQEEISNLPHWKQEGKYLIRKVIFTSFKEALETMQVIGVACDRMNHHPEWTNVYNRLEIKLTTHDTGDISSKDILLAQKINEIIG